MIYSPKFTLTHEQTRVLEHVVAGQALYPASAIKINRKGWQLGQLGYVSSLTVDSLVAKGLLSVKGGKGQIPIARLTKAGQTYWHHRLETCECGDYRWQHVNGTGRCSVCSYAPADPAKPCKCFRLARKITAKEKLDVTYPKELG